jgi:hypothetical protein
VKKAPKKEKDIPRINKAFAALVDSNDSQTEAAELLGFRSQDIGYYMKGRKIPPELIAACRKEYGYDLIDLEGMDFEHMVLKKKEWVETIVSRGTGYVPSHVLDHYRNTSEHIMEENRNLWDIVKGKLRVEVQGSK